jgi:hypothetical protein
VGGIHGASRDIDRPAGVAFTFQISAYSVEPTVASRSRNLFSHNDRGPAGTDEAKEVGPQVPRIVRTSAPARDREGLTRARPGPERPTVRPAGEPGGDRPESATCEQVDLRVSGDVMGGQLLYWCCVYGSCRDAAFVHRGT